MLRVFDLDQSKVSGGLCSHQEVGILAPLTSDVLTAYIGLFCNHLDGITERHVEYERVLTQEALPLILGGVAFQHFPVHLNEFAERY
ncbi:hypothetical protein D3C85_1248400 [compost metagenome]